MSPSTVVEVPQSDEESPGWWRLQNSGRLLMRCPNGHISHLQHDVNPDGTVYPSVVCPREDCGFHEWVELQDYTGGGS